ncbi:MAG: hypothetical protein ACRD9S_14710 [Pyrinomonadaceae bacterium]
MRRSIIPLLFLTLPCLLPVGPAQAQGTSTSLQPGVTIENALALGQSHSFSINLDEDQFLQLVVDQHGIDVIVRAFSAEGKSLGEFDTPNGTEGPENVSLISVTAGVYRIEVAPLGQTPNAPPGRYEIRILELRHATDDELQAGKNQEVLKARGLALLAETAEGLGQIRLPQTRVRAQLQTAQLLWPSNEKLAAKLAADAVEAVKEYMAGAETSDRDYYQTYSLAMQLRQETVLVLGQHDPESALSFLRATRTLANPSGQSNQPDQELQLELSLASQIAAADPKGAMRIGQETLKRGYSSTLIELIFRLRSTDPELATQLAKEAVAKLMGENLLGNQEASQLAVNLLRLAHSPAWRNQRSPGAPAQQKSEAQLLSDQEYKDLFEKALSEALAYKVPAVNQYSTERNAAQNILSTLNSMKDELKTYAPERLVMAEKRIKELNPSNSRWQKYQEAINSGSVDAVLEEVGRAPQDMRESLYQMIAQKIASTGDVARAKQIVKDGIANPQQRLNVLSNIEQQAIQMEISKGKIEAALRSVSNMRTPRERAMMLTQIAGQIGPGLKRAQALELLEQARSMLGASAYVENQEQMGALLEIARAFARYDSKRAFEIVEPLLDQFNEISVAALVMNGFGQESYQDGELQMQNGSPVSNVANQLVRALGTLTTANFDRAKAGADRLERQEVRITAYLAIAQQAIGANENRAARGRVGSRTIIRQ